MCKATVCGCPACLPGPGSRCLQPVFPPHAIAGPRGHGTNACQVVIFARAVRRWRGPCGREHSSREARRKPRHPPAAKKGPAGAAAARGASVTRGQPTLWNIGPAITGPMFHRCGFSSECHLPDPGAFAARLQDATTWALSVMTWPVPGSMSRNPPAFRLQISQRGTVSARESSWSRRTSLAVPQPASLAPYLSSATVMSKMTAGRPSRRARYAEASDCPRGVRRAPNTPVSARQGTPVRHAHRPDLPAGHAPARCQTVPRSSRAAGPAHRRAQRPLHGRRSTCRSAPRPGTRRW